MELSQIKYFIQAAQSQNLSKAARILNITQPTLSKSISNLESEMGVQLFDRFGKKMTLNDNGREFLENAAASIQELENAVAAAKNQGTKSALNLGLFRYSESFMRCLADFSAANPDVTYHITHLEIVSRNVDTNEFDMLLYPMDPLFSKYKGDRIYSDPYYLAVHRSNPLSERDSVKIDDASAYQVIFIRNDSKQYDLPYHLGTRRNISARDNIFTNNYEIQRWLVSNNIGVGFVPKGCSGSYAADPDIALIHIDHDKLKQDIMVGFKREKHLSAAGRAFSAYVRNYYGI